MNETRVRSATTVRAAWGVLGALVLACGAAESPGLMPSNVGPPGLALWTAGALILFSSARAARVESAWRDAMRRKDVRVALSALVVLWVLLADLVGVYGALLALTALGLLGLGSAAMWGGRLFAATVVNGALAGSGVALVLVALEGVVRLPGIAAILGTTPELASWSTRYDRLWERNIFGFRSRHETMARSPGSLRILALGDSYTWGDKIANSDSTWSALLERELALALPGQTVEVINMGRNGFTTANEAEMLRRVGWQFEPDIVLLQFLYNDVLPSGPNLQRESSAYVLPRHTLVPLSLRSGHIRSSALLQLLEDRYSLLRNRSSVNPWHALYEESFVGWKQTKEALHEMGAASAERGVPIYFLMFPRLGALTGLESHPDEAIHRQVIAVAEKASMRIIDLVPLFADGRTDPADWWATPYDGHPSVRAHLAASRYLRDVLMADGIGVPH